MEKADSTLEKVMDEIDGFIRVIKELNREFVDDPVNTVVGPEAVEHEAEFSKAVKDVFQEYDDIILDWIKANTVNEMIETSSLKTLTLDAGKLNDVLYDYMTKGIGLAGQKAVDKISLGVNFDLQNARAMSWLDAYTLQLSDKTTARVTGNIKQSLLESYMKGESVDKGVERVKEVMTNAKGYEAERIVRSEHARCMSEGSLAGYQQEGVEYVTLVISKDEWTCAACREAAIKYDKVPVDEVIGLLPLHPNDRCCWVPWVEE